jgi:hypothetical protein
MNIARKPPINPPPLEDNADRDRRLLLEMLFSKQAEVDAAERDKTRMQRDIDELRYWRRIGDDARKAESTAQDAQIWAPLTAAAIDLVGIELRDYERVREWCASSKVVAKKVGPNWLVEMTGARKYAASRGIEPPSPWAKTKS